MNQRSPIPATAAETSPEHPWPVRMLTNKLTEYLAKAPAVWIEGQVVQLTRRPGQATCYLTLRDTDVDLSFNVTIHTRILDSMPVPLADGARVVLHARVELWPKRGSLSLSADAIRPVGVGELLARLEHLRRVLAAEGLFADDRKRPLPFLPTTVGLICGRASAAERDVVQNARRRWPGVQFEIRPVAVQGGTAVTEVIQALESLDAEPGVEVIVIARGGGSLEDLLPFSNEALIRAVAACRTPVISAIGHEVDTPLLDLVADVRASTPTDAGRRVVPDAAEEFARIEGARTRIAGALTQRLEREGALVATARERIQAQCQRSFAAAGQECQMLSRRARVAVHSRLDRGRDDLAHLRERVVALSPRATMARGYAVVTDAQGHLLTQASQAQAGDELAVTLAVGSLSATVTRVEP